MSPSTLLESFIEHSQSEETLQAVWSRLVKEKVVPVDGSFGTADRRKKLSKAVSGSAAKADLPKIYSAVAIELSDMYADKKKNVNRIFMICIIAILLSVLLLLTGLSISFWRNNSGQVSMISTASSIITAFLSGTFFWFYKRENSKLAAIENDIRKIKVLEGFAAIASNMQNQEILNTAYQKIIVQMNL